MKAYILVSFLVMGAAYWQMSGGADFRPEAWPDEAATVASVGASVGASAGTSSAVPGEAAAPEVATRSDVQPGDIADVVVPAPELDVPADALAAGAAVPAEALSAAEALAAVAPDLAAALPLVEASVAETVGARRVTGDRVNMREGPGTDFAVVGQLAQGDMAEVIEADGGWVRVRAAGGEGWMAERFLAAGG